MQIVVNSQLTNDWLNVDLLEPVELNSNLIKLNYHNLVYYNNL